MHLDLQADEVSALLQALYWYIPELREEIGSTEDYDMREGLKAQEASLTSLVAKLGGSIAETNLPDIGADNPPWGG
ncbi:MAG: hypothetical protein QOH93_762 [Chloroflexia bacterium]|jgi:hypothetical protein|nr:hypothetical protein [Chloroflexia bacterium]